ncbi:uncharacterized protein LOC126894726 [Daktulosphaira vitifoliae]|uniref:uncharacterized protein LOC126894726 n=1 Tax=Daktulosphaira vitifoliae TaxID=58002 RepID=UPI0021A9D0FB|nr:uncharacterized protein LOC126894726 [Daktulosphaira vitifoliae]
MPVDVEWQVSKCNELNLLFIEVSSKELHYKFLKSPKIKIETKGDGSCFFNALSYWITGSDEFGQELRKKIIDFLADSKNFKLMTLDYKWQKRIDEMHDSRVYAESSEIAAAAEYLKTSIYVYTDDNGWNFFNKDDVFGNDNGEKCIYLINKVEHFMPVVDTTKHLAPIEEKSEIAAAAKYLKTPICVYADDDGWKLFNKNFVFENEKFIYLIYDKEQYTPVINVNCLSITSDCTS